MGISLDIRDNKFFQEAYTTGIQDGEVKGEALALRRLIEHRFGTITEAVENQLSQLSRAEIEQAIVRVLDAKNIAEVFASPSN